MEFRSYFAPLIKWWWLIILAMILAGGTSVFAVRQQSLVYQSRSTLMIGRVIDDPNPTNSQFVLGQQLAQRYADIAGRQPLRVAVMEELGLDWLPEFTVRADTQLVNIVVLDSDPVRAQAVANELANQLINLSPSNVQAEDQERQEFIDSQLDDLQIQLEETQAEILIKQGELGNLFSARQIEETQNEIAALETKRNLLQDNFASLLATTQETAINALTIFEPATLPTLPVGPKKELTVVISVTIAFLLTVGAAYILEYMDDTVKTAEDINQFLELPTLANILQIKDEEDSSILITQDQPRSPISEAFRILRTSIQFSDVDKTKRIIMVTSSISGEGKSLISANLGIVFAQAGHNVLLVDADLRRPTLHKKFNLIGEKGLTNLLLQATPNSNHSSNEGSLINDFIQTTREPGLNVLTSGPIPPNPSELLGSVKMKSTLKRLSEQFDIIVLDSPPSLAITDSVVLSTLVDGVVFVIKSGETRRNILKEGVLRLKEVNAPIIGIALNQISAANSGYYNYYYNSKESEDHEWPVKNKGQLTSSRSWGSSM